MSGPERSPVLSLTLVDATTMRDGVLLATSDVLIAARRPGANRTHPNVVSVPTQRIPASLHADLLSAASHEETTDRGVSFFDGGEVDSGFDDGHHPVVFAVESLLGRKLGLAEALENGEVEYRAALRAGVRGTAVYDNLGPRDVYERIDMLNVLVVLTKGREHLPAITSSYGPVAFTTVKAFVDGVENRDPRTLDPSLDAIEFCIHGVCLAAARETLLRHTGSQPMAAPRTPREDPLELRLKADG